MSDCTKIRQVQRMIYYFNYFFIANIAGGASLIRLFQTCLDAYFG